LDQLVPRFNPQDFLLPKRVQIGLGNLLLRLKEVIDSPGPGIPTSGVLRYIHWRPDQRLAAADVLCQHKNSLADLGTTAEFRGK
jgi:hypothetical protein